MFVYLCLYVYDGIETKLPKWEHEFLICRQLFFVEQKNLICVFDMNEFENRKRSLITSRKWANLGTEI